MSGDIAGRTVIVTGGGAGIGLGLVRHLGSLRANVVVAEVNPQTMADAVADAESRGGRALGVRTDVTDQASIFGMVDQALERFGRVDGIVNNALVPIPLSPVMDVSEDQLDRFFRGHVKAALWGMQAVYPHMQAQGWGRIVNVGSSAGLVGFAGFASYAIAKEGVRALTRTAAREWKRDGIVVNCFCPVSLHHPEPDNADDESAKLLSDPHGHVAASVRVLEELAPTGTAHTKVDPEHDLAPTVAFLLSDGCGYLTGQTVTLDGGAYAFA